MDFPKLGYKIEYIEAVRLDSERDVVTFTVKQDNSYLQVTMPRRVAAKLLQGLALAFSS